MFYGLLLSRNRSDVMNSDLFYKLIVLIGTVSIGITLKDQYFHLGEQIAFLKNFAGSLIFVILGIGIMASTIMYFIENRFIRKLKFIGDGFSAVIGIVISCLLMYALKYFIVKIIHLQFKYSIFVITADLIFMMIFPLAAYILLKNFKHGH